MKRMILRALSGLMALATIAFAQTTTSGGSMTSTTSTGFAPINFGNVILTSTPSNATGSSGVSTVYTTSGDQFTFGTGGRLVDPMQFNYVITGPNSATIDYPATASSPALKTNLVFTSANSGTYTTVSGTNTTTGTFGLSSIPGAAPIENVSARTTVTNGGTTIVGFVIGGTMPHRVLIRAVGPGLASFGVTNPLQNPMVSLYRGTELIATNDNWGTLLTSTAMAGATSGNASTGSASTPTGTTTNGVFTGTLANGNTFTTQLATAADFTQVGAFGLTVGSNDAAFVATLPPGAYTVLVTSSSTATVAASTSTKTSSTTATSGTTAGTSTTSSSSTTAGSTTGTSTTSTSSTASGSTTSGGVTTGGSSTGTSTTSTASTGTTSGGTASGSGTTTLTSSSGTTTNSATSSTTGDVLVEVYFLQ